MTKITKLQVFMDFNILNAQETTDDNYTFDNVHPVVNGVIADVTHLKTLDGNGDATLTKTPD